MGGVCLGYHTKKGLLFHAARTRLGTVSSKEVSAWMARLARRKARKMTKAQRTALALKMNEARWAKARKAKQEGTR